MRLMSQLTSRMGACQLDATAGNPLFVAYAFRSPQGRQQAVVIINKDAEKQLEVTIQVGSAGRVSIERLIAPRLDDEQETTLGGVATGGDGAWKPEVVEHARIANGMAQVSIPAGSAALLRWD